MRLTATVEHVGREYVAECVELELASTAGTPSDAIVKLHDALEEFTNSDVYLSVLAEGNC